MYVLDIYKKNISQKLKKTTTTTTKNYYIKILYNKILLQKSKKINIYFG